MIKHGKTKPGIQRYICKACGKTRVENYGYHTYRTDTNQKIIQLTKEGLGIRSTARILKISATTLLKRIFLIARNIVNPDSADISTTIAQICNLYPQSNSIMNRKVQLYTVLFIFRRCLVKR
ncbi:hypothetical protein ASE21_20825 [Flavobacterium sp. Root901]|uniref:IS1/IS1595 family N-terminal zinc-binding domain-containing protein n=1 Tax=Flavobacterium sp. Root901 TaxID=1736605 RepID=UPI0007090A8E|nr:IS1-like element transposase [Flavobacterium sp. Root901]KRD05404.1 hypothetical protein ASE21_20825 [Flavobacterium sp. Root901]